MKTLAMVCALVLSVMSNVACHQLEYKSTGPHFASPFVLDDTATTVQALEGTAQDSVSVDDSFYVSMEVVFHASQAAQYPITASRLQDALMTWANVLPVRFSIYIEDNESPMSFFGFGQPSFVDRWNIVEILIDDLQGPPYNMRPGILGIWIAEDKRIVLDGDVLETNSAMAYSVILHELGHMFGLPHIVGFTESASTGILVLPDGVDAESYVMYPTMIENKSQDHLSELEITLAKHYLIHILTSFDVWRANLECNLTHRP